MNPIKKKFFKKSSIYLFSVFLLFYIIIHVMAYRQQEGLIFFPQKLSTDYKFKFPIDFEEVWIQSKNERLNAVIFKKPNPKGLIIFAHGNNGNIKTWYPAIEELLNYQYNILVFDFRGYGKSSGQIESEKDLHDDTWAVIQYGRKFFTDDKIILYGRSLGTGPIIKSATLFKPKLVILETPYLNLKYLAQRFYPFLFSYMLKYPVRTENWATYVTAPVTVIHGTYDELIRISDVEKLFSQFPFPRRFYKVEGGYHNDLNDYPIYKKMLDDNLLN